MSVGENIKKARIEAGLTQLQLAEKINTVYQQIGYWESGRREPRLAQISRIACALGVSMDYLIERNMEYDSPRFPFNSVHAKLESLPEADKKVIESMIDRLVALGSNSNAP
jgi:transcriptional regulator with XRE-family HTH domain